MAKVVRQFRFYTMNSGSTMYTKNYPRDAKVQDYSSGSVFDKIGCFPIVQLGVQALPGTKMYLNGSTESIIIGSTGIYELDLDGIAETVQLQFDYESMMTINNNDTAGLIVDIIWDDGAAEEEES